MPLQWLPLQQRQQQRQPARSPVSEALTPQGRGATIHDYSFLEREAAQQEAEDKRKHELKLMDKQMEMVKFQAGLKEDTRKGAAPMTAGQVLGRPAPTGVPALTKENMPQAAKTMWEFILTLDEAGQKFFINQLKEKEQPTGGFIEAGGKRMEMPGSVGMYGHLVDQGLIDPATDTVIEKGREFEKGTFEITEEGGTVYQLNTATGERKQLGTVDEPEGVVNAINKQANADALALSKAGEGVSFEDAKHDALIDYGVDEEVAADMARVKEIPPDPSKKSWYKNFVNWLKGGKIAEGWQPKGAGAVAFNEANVSSLVPVISDNVTTVERAHLKTQ